MIFVVDVIDIPVLTVLPWRVLVNILILLPVLISDVDVVSVLPNRLEYIVEATFNVDTTNNAILIELPIIVENPIVEPNSDDVFIPLIVINWEAIDDTVIVLPIIVENWIELVLKEEADNVERFDVFVLIIDEK